MRHSLLKALLLIIAIGGLTVFLFSISPEKYYLKPTDTLHNKTYTFTQRFLPRKLGLDAIWTFEDDVFQNTLSSIIACGTTAARGRYGTGCKFDGKDGSFLATQYEWPLESGDFTISFWLNIKPLPVSQDIICTWQKQIMGFRLESGRMCFDYPSYSNKYQTASYEFSNYNKFVHIAAVGNTEKGMLSLFENGELKTSIPMTGFIPFSWRLIFGRGDINLKRDCFNGTIDEIALWSRPLSESEIKSIAHSSFGLEYTKKTAFRKIKNHFYKLKVMFFAKLGRSVHSESFKIHKLFSAQCESTKLPYISIHFPGKSFQHLLKAHARSIASGHKTKAGATPVRAAVSINGIICECRISLAGGNLSYPYRERPAFLIEPAEGTNFLPGGFSRIEITPPETSGWLNKLAESILWEKFKYSNRAFPTCSLYRLRINGAENGVYLVSDVSRQAVIEGDAFSPLTFSYRGQTKYQKEYEIQKISPPCISRRTSSIAKSYLSPSEIASVISELSSAGKILWADPHSPIPRKLRNSILEKCISKIQMDIHESRAAEELLLDEELVLGNNRSAFLLEQDLDFSSVSNATAGRVINFKSLSPDWINESGHILKRPDYGPTNVTLLATITDSESHVVTKNLQFRLLPNKRKIKSLIIWTDRPIGRNHRTDATVEIIDQSGPATSSRLLLATSSRNGGGIRYKGNSSFNSQQKLLNIKVDHPHGLFGSTQTRSIIMINNTVMEQLRVWNRLSFSLFRDFPKRDGSKYFAPQVICTELFINGKYYGLSEFAEQIDGDMLENNSIEVFRHRTARPRNCHVRQARPAPCESDCMEHFNSFQELLESPITENTYTQITNKFDVESLIDYQILYSFSGNINGAPYSFWTHDVIVYNRKTKKFFYVPWDFDASGGESLPLVRTYLDKKLAEISQDHRHAVAARWKELRETTLSEENVQALYDSILKDHLPYLPADLSKRYGQQFSEDDIRAMREKDHKFIIEHTKKLDVEFSEY